VADTAEQLSRAVEWLEKADFEAKIVIAGNHDITLDHDFYSKHGSSFHNQNPQDPARCQSLLTSSRTITYLQNSSATIRLTRPDGPGTEFTVFGSPYSPRIGKWAFMYSRRRPKPDAPDSSSRTSPNAKELWAAIPPSTDILVTHTPPYAHQDDTFGCRELRKALARVRPRLHVCGHIHQSRGAERVRWETDSLDATDGVTAAEASVEAWEDPNPDPASAKISLLDLTARGGKRPLDFDDPGPSPETPARCDTFDLSDPAQQTGCGSVHSGPDSQDSAGSGDPTRRVADPDSPTRLAVERESTGQTTPMGREGRRETCVVNCAIVASKWPHPGGKQFNKPIVVDLDLPVWR